MSHPYQNNVTCNATNIISTFVYKKIDPEEELEKDELVKRLKVRKQSNVFTF